MPSALGFRVAGAILGHRWYDDRGTHEARESGSRFVFDSKKRDLNETAGGLFNLPQNGVLLAPRPSLVPRSDKANRAAPVAPQ